MRKEKKLIKKLFFVIIILLAVLVVLLVVDFNIFESFKKLFAGPDMIVIKDNCGLVYGTLLHDIKSEDNCNIRCINECGLLEENFVRVEFIGRDNSCNECNCYCK